MNKDSLAKKRPSQGNNNSKNKIDSLKDTPLISIIVPVYNVEEFLPKCLDSLINQTYRHLELILVNDGSKDNSLEICYEYSKSDSRIKVINQSNQGMSVARNVALQASSGEFILYVDSDDFLSTESLEILLTQQLKDKSDICIVEKTYWYYGKNKTKEFRLTENYQKCYLDEILLIDDIHLYSPCTKLYKRSFLENIDFPAGLLHEDVFYWIAILAKQPKISIGFGSVYYYRKNNDFSITRIGNNMRERKVHLAKSFRMGVDFALDNNVSDNFKLCLLNSFFLFCPSPEQFSIEDEQYIIRKLLASTPNYIKSLESKSELVREYQYLFKVIYYDKRLLRINLFPRFRRYVLDFSIKFAGLFTFRFIFGRAV